MASKSETVEFQGVFYRLIDLRAWNDTTVVGWLEDDRHHFGMTLCHDGSVITDVRAAAYRHPWNTCPAAAESIRVLVGQPLFGRCSDIGRLVDMRRQCTHLFDLAGLLAVHAYHRRCHRRYRGSVCRIDGVPTSAPGGRLHATLERDGADVLWWDVEDGLIVQPDACAGRSVDRGFREWTEAMGEDAAEDAFVLRRVVFVSKARTFRNTIVRLADETDIPAVCHSYQPGSREIAIRMKDYVRDPHAGEEGMLSLVETQP